MGASRRVTPLWLSHHFPEDYDRCVMIAGRHVCRRCSALYPPAFVVLAIAVVTGWAAPGAALWLFVLLPLPGVVEFVAEHLGVVRHSPQRQVALSVLVGAGLGVGFARYVHDPADLTFWTVVVVYGATCAVAAWYRQHRATTTS